MNFSSPIFLFYFLPLFLLIYNLISREKRNFVILLWSCIFFCWGSLPSALLLFLTSILVVLFHYLEKHQVYSERDFYFYYKQNIKYPANTCNPIDRRNLDLKREILGKDIVVIETNETALNVLGYGFVENALKALEKD